MVVAFADVAKAPKDLFKKVDQRISVYVEQKTQKILAIQCWKDRYRYQVRYLHLEELCCWRQAQKRARVQS